MAVNRGRIAADKGGAANMVGVYAGGDCVSGPATVIKAIAAGKAAAANIDEYLGYHHPISCDVEIPEPMLNDKVPCGRVNLQEVEAWARKTNFEGIELPFNTYKQSYQRTTYWKFELDESAEVNFLFNAPTNKNFSAVVYNENGVYAYEEANEISEMSVYLDAGTYYVKTNVPSIGEDCIQIRIWK